MLRCTPAPSRAVSTLLVSRRHVDLSMQASAMCRA